MRTRLPEGFLRQPHTKLVVKVVEPFREQSATSAFYEPPGADDGRPGMYCLHHEPRFNDAEIQQMHVETLHWKYLVPNPIGVRQALHNSQVSAMAPA